MDNTAKQKLIFELRELEASIASYQGNRLTHYQPFQTLMMEEKINILADAITLLLAYEISELESPKQEEKGI